MLNGAAIRHGRISRRAERARPGTAPEHFPWPRRLKPPLQEPCVASSGSQGLARVNEVIRDTMRDPFSGIDKPEPLRGNLKGWWSRPITQEHRFVYRCENQTLVTLQCRFHYDD